MCDGMLKRWLGSSSFMLLTALKTSDYRSVCRLRLIPMSDSWV